MLIKILKSMEEMEEEKNKNRFTEEQLLKIKEAVDKWVVNYPCEICKNTNWLLDGFMVNLPITNKFVVSLSGPILPLVPITCSRCGNTHFLNLAVLGMLDVIRDKEGKK